MNKLVSDELFGVDGGAIFYTPFDLISYVYRVIKIRWLMKKLFID